MIGWEREGDGRRDEIGGEMSVDFAVKSWGDYLQ